MKSIGQQLTLGWCRTRHPRRPAAAAPPHDGHLAASMLPKSTGQRWARMQVRLFDLAWRPGKPTMSAPHQRDAQRGGVLVQQLLHVHAGCVGALVQHAEARAVEEQARHAHPLLLACGAGSAVTGLTSAWAKCPAGPARDPSSAAQHQRTSLQGWDSAGGWLARECTRHRHPCKQEVLHAFALKHVLVLLN